MSLSVSVAYTAWALAVALASCSCDLRYAKRELRRTEAMSLSRCMELSEACLECQPDQMFYSQYWAGELESHECQAILSDRTLQSLDPLRPHTQTNYRSLRRRRVRGGGTHQSKSRRANRQDTKQPRRSSEQWSHSCRGPLTGWCPAGEAGGLYAVRWRYGPVRVGGTQRTHQE